MKLSNIKKEKNTLTLRSGVEKQDLGHLGSNY